MARHLGPMGTPHLGPQNEFPKNPRLSIKLPPIECWGTKTLAVWKNVVNIRTFFLHQMYQQKSFRSSRPNQFKPSAPSGYNFQELPADYQRRGQNYSNFMPPEGPNYRAPYRFNIYWNIGLFGALIVMWVSETVEFKKYEYTLEREHLFAQERQPIFTFGNIDSKGIWVFLSQVWKAV